MLCKAVDEASRSTDAVVVDSFVVCSGLEALVGSCSERVVSVMTVSEEAVELPLAYVEECSNGQVEAMVVVDDVKYVGMAAVAEKLLASLGLVLLGSNVEEPFVVAGRLRVLLVVVLLICSIDTVDFTGDV